ncbi:MAG TPA: acetylglutamate kinase, partial [Gemmatimonadales bacterium]
MLNLRVVKLGGNELDRPEWMEECARALRQAAPVVVVHGGGKAVDALSRRLGLPVEKRDGLRVTTADVAEAVEMTLAGAISRRLVSTLRRAGLDALGLAGVDGGLFRARVAPGGLGYVGEIVEVRTALLESLLLAGFTPVIAPVAPPADAEAAVPLNINADYAAAAVAGALGAGELLFVSDVPGVEVDGVAQPAIAVREIEALIANGVATNGMVTKLRAASQALTSGARAV